LHNKLFTLSNLIIPKLKLITNRTNIIYRTVFMYFTFISFLLIIREHRPIIISGINDLLIIIRIFLSIFNHLCLINDWISKAMLIINKTSNIPRPTLIYWTFNNSLLKTKEHIVIISNGIVEFLNIFLIVSFMIIN